MTSYEQALFFLNALPIPSFWDLEKTKELFRLTNTPTNALRVIHVTGSNGKGSTTAFIASILSEQGYVVGVDTSPHLVTPRERIRVNQEIITEQEFIEIFDVVKPAIQGMADKPSFFEAMTVFAVKHFLNKRVDYAVIEVGLGGRLDSTNVLDSMVSVITNVSLEHTEMLGGSVEKIAFEKAGIIKPSNIVVTACTEPALSIVRQKAKEQDCELIIVEEPTKIKTTESGTSFDYKSESHSCSLLGMHQAINACTAIETINALRKKKIEVSDAAIKNGLMHAEWPGRLQVLSRKPLVVIDGAHNPDGIKTLVESIRVIWPNRKVILVFGVMKDKNYEEMISLLKQLPLAKTILVKAMNPRSEEPAVLAKYFDNVLIEESVVEALEKAKTECSESKEKNEEKGSSESELVLVTGSLYVLGELLSSQR